MKNILPLALLCASSIGAFALPSFEPFADATGTGGTSYANAAPLAGQINAYGEKWYGIATGQTGAAVVLTNVSLAASNGMPASSGSAVVLVNQLGPGARFNVGTNSTASPMTLFYSAFIQVNDATSLIVANQGGNAGGGFNMGFNNTTGTDTAQTTQPTAYAAPLYIGGYNSGYGIGIGRATGAAGNRFWESGGPHALGDIVFVVVEYEAITGAANDVVRLWVNPDSSTFGAAAYPTPDVIVGDAGHVPTSDADIATINSFLLANRNAGTPNQMIVDELRLGTTWAQVTSTNNSIFQPLIQPKLAAAIVTPSTVQLSWGTNSTGFTLQSTSTLLSSGTAWSPVAGSATVSGTNYVQTDAIAGAKFYRLSHP